MIFWRRKPGRPVSGFGLCGLAVGHDLLRRGSLADELDVSLVVHTAGQQQVLAKGCLAGHADQRQVGKSRAVGLGQAVAGHIR